MFKKIKLLSILLILIALPVNASVNTLWEYYNLIGEKLPSISERAEIYAEIAPGELYTGSAVQNTKLLKTLQIYQPEKDFGMFFGASGGDSDLPQVIANFESSLVSRIDSDDTSMTLVDSTDDDGNTLSGWYGFTVDSASSKREYIIGNCTGATCSSLMRGISFKDGISTSTARAYDHGRGTDVSITDHPSLTIITEILNGNDGVPDTLYYDSNVSSTTIGAELNGNVIPNRDYVTYLANSYGATSTFWTLGINLTDLYYNGGDVGIGTIDPERKLDIAEVDGTSALRIYSTAGVTNNLSLSTTEFEMNRSNGSNSPLAFATKSTSWGTGENAGDIIFYPNDSEALRLDKAGNIGIGSSTPDSTLSVVGDTHITGTTTIDGGLTADGQTTGFGLVTFGTGADGVMATSTSWSLDRDYHFTNATVDNGVTIQTNGYRMFVNNTLTFTGTGKIAEVGNAGSNGTGGTGGSGGATAHSAGTLPTSNAGARGSDGDCNGACGETGAGDGVDTAKSFNSINAGTGGADCTTSGIFEAGETGANSDTYDSPFNNILDIHFLRDYIDNNDRGQGVPSPGGGCGGNYAGGSPYATGGGGGGAGSPGGIVWVSARNIVTVDGNDYIDVSGGDGGDGQNGSSCNSADVCAGGGGAGKAGAGGIVFLIYETKTGSGTINLDGGTSGNEGTGGINAGAGADGPDGGTVTDGVSGVSHIIQVGSK